MNRFSPCLLVLAAVVCVPQLSPAAEQRPEERYTLFVELRHPFESNRAALRKMLEAEGHESFPEGEREIALVLTAEQIGRLFQARVRYRYVEASAAPGIRSEPQLEGARIPGRFEKLIRRVYFDPQRG